MTQTIQTRFKRVETKYIVPAHQLDALLQDLDDYLRADDYPTSTISNIYFDTPDFEVIKDALAKKNLREKIRMRSYIAQPQLNSPAFLEIKQKDQDGVGHKLRLVATAERITQLLSSAASDEHISDPELLKQIQDLRKRYPNLSPKMFIYYDRFSLKQKKGAPDKVRITFDSNLRYRDSQLNMEVGNFGLPLLENQQMIMEIKASSQKPLWLQTILDRHGLTKVKFSKYAAAYHKSQGLPYQPKPRKNKDKEDSK